MGRQHLIAVPMVENILADLNIENIADPYGLSDLCFNLMLPHPRHVSVIKNNRNAEGQYPHFNKLAHTLRAGRPNLTERQIKEILHTYNDFSEEVEFQEKWAADIAWHFKISSSFAGKGRALLSVIRFLRPEEVLEIGTAYGMSATFMLLGMDRYEAHGHLSTIELSEPQFSLSSRYLTARFGERVNCLRGRSEEKIPEVLAERESLDFVFHDGGHDYDSYINDFRSLRNHMRPGGVFFFDDIRWGKKPGRSDPCYKAWREIINDPKVSAAFEVDRSMGLALLAG